MKKILAHVLALTMLVGLAACGNSASSPGEQAQYKVGICQLEQHTALDEATEGFTDALREELGDSVSFNIQNAGGELSVCSSIVNQFLAEEVDLILANATPALQAAAAATADTPILGTSVTEYGVALELEGFNGTVGGNISGTSDFAPLDAQAKMIADWFPEAESVALLYCSSEVNSQYQVEAIKAELEKLGYTAEYYSFSDSNDMAGVVEAAAAECDIIYVPTDNTVASCAAIIDNICRPIGKPVIGGESGMCEICSLASLSIEYYDIGYTTGKMAARILAGGEDISTMPIGYADYSAVYNADICAALGLTPPEGYEPLA